MRAATRAGNAGAIGLVYNHRVSKSDPRVEAYPPRQKADSYQ